jgi:tetratricopeptide (TPR) repeat protein
LALEPKNGNYHDSLGWAFFKQGRYPAALAELKQAVELLRAQGEVVDPVVYDHLGEAYRKLGRRDEAASSWREALKEDPGNLDIRGKLDQLAPGKGTK